MDALTAAAFGVSLVSLGFAYRSHRKSITVTQYGNATDRTLEVDKLFIDHPELRPLFTTTCRSTARSTATAPSRWRSS